MKPRSWFSIEWIFGNLLVRLVVVLWVVLIAISFFWNWHQIGESVTELAVTTARSHFDKDVLYRRWAAMHGGVYVVPTDKTPPNPYLTQVPDRDVTTTSGKKLTLVNPAYMTRQVHELGWEGQGVRGHITSLNPIRPENVADAWETVALQAFESGAEEFSSLEVMDGLLYLRLMRPLVTERGCLQCHSEQGYKEGEIRGGISVSVPFEPYGRIAGRQRASVATGHALILVLGLLGLWFGWNRFRRTAIKREQIEEALRESEAKYRMMFRTNPDAINLNRASDGTYLDINEGFTNTMGYTREDFVGKTPIHLNIWDDPKDRERLVAALKKDGFVQNMEARFRGKDGIVRTGLMSARLLEINGESVLLSITRDISEYKKIEEALRESEERFKELAELLPQCVYEADTDGIFTYANRRAFELFGYTHEDFEKGLNVIHMVIPEERARAKAAIEKVFMRASPGKEYGYTGLKKDGSSFAMDIYSSPIIRQGKTVGMRGIVVDMTERRRAEERIRQSEDLFRAAFESAPVGMAIIDRETGFIKVNEQICRSLGYHADELEGRSFNDFTHPDDRQGGRERWNQLLSGKGTFNVAEKRYIHKDGRIVWAIVSNSLIYTKEKEPLYFVSHLIDISDRKQAEADKAKLQEQLSQAQKMESVGRLAGGVAHDFNNKLGIIIGNVEMAMMEAELAAPIRQELEEIMNAAQHSAALVRQLLGFARKQTVSPKVLDLNDTVSGMLKMLRRLIGEDIDLAWMPGHDLWQVKMDPAQVDQILANLAVNARDAISGVGKVTIETDNVTLDEDYCAVHAGCIPGQYALLAVSDDGAGMEKEVLEHLFEPFFTTKEVGKGTGLGLSTVYGIVKQNKGFVNVYSEPGRGSTFKIYLPRFEMDGIADKKEASPETPKGAAETVLLVEDEESILKVGKAMLERLGYRVLAAGRPSAAIRLVGEHAGPIHLVLTDVVMPELNGKELVEQLKSKCPGLKCLYMSGYTANVIAHHGVLDKGVSMIQKPFSLRDLATKVREVLDRT
jgi:PAS domain S-box-containing protein